MKRKVFGNQAGPPEVGVKKKPRKTKHQIHLLKTDEGYHWAYVVDNTVRCRSPKVWSAFTVASRTAYGFRKLLANADEVEIIPPEGHRYSGDPKEMNNG